MGRLGSAYRPPIFYELRAAEVVSCCLSISGFESLGGSQILCSIHAHFLQSPVSACVRDVCRVRTVSALTRIAG
jgi:hypothetical protein